MSLNTKVDFNYDDNQWVIKPIGEIDIYTSSVFKEEIVNAFENRKADLVIEGEHLEYIDSTGLGALISVLKMLQETEFKIYIDNIKPNIRKLFDITELDKLFVIRGEGDE
ncbi:MAG TPA: STAS domain-containing protein [Tissierellaceae bacterium]|jgi:anti-sigma B factor antagonist|nr:STAS domain-containing protein [Tissierellaceae bacterium]